MLRERGQSCDQRVSKINGSLTMWVSSTFPEQAQVMQRAEMFISEPYRIHGWDATGELPLADTLGRAEWMGSQHIDMSRRNKMATHAAISEDKHPGFIIYLFLILHLRFSIRESQQILFQVRTQYIKHVYCLMYVVPVGSPSCKWHIHFSLLSKNSSYD